MAEYIEKTSFIEHLKKDPLFDLVEQYGITGVIESFPAKDVQPVKWIPVTERLPQIEKDVLVCAYGTLIRTWCLHKKYSKRFWETEEGYFDDFNAVSHWMPLPDLPKDGET